MSKWKKGIRIIGKDGKTPIPGVDFEIPQSIKGDKGDKGDPGKDAEPAKVIEKIKELKGNDRIDINLFKGSEYLVRLEQLNTKLQEKARKGNLDMSDLRWHGGGLTAVSHDSTLSGDGTPTSPLGVASSILDDYVLKAGDTMTGELLISIIDKGSGVDTPMLSTATTGAYTTGFEVGQFDLTATGFGDLGKYTELRGTSNGYSGNLLGVKDNLLITGYGTGLFNGFPSLAFIDNAFTGIQGLYYDTGNNWISVDGTIGSGNFNVENNLTTVNLSVSGSFEIDSMTIGLAAGEQVVLSHDDTLDALTISQRIFLSDGSLHKIFAKNSDNFIDINYDTQTDGAVWQAKQSVGVITGTWTAFCLQTPQSLLATETMFCLKKDTGTTAVDVFKVMGDGHIRVLGGSLFIDSDNNCWTTLRRAVKATDNVGFAWGEIGQTDSWDFYMPVNTCDLWLSNISTGIHSIIVSSTDDTVYLGKNLVIGHEFLNGNDIVVQFGETGAGLLSNKGFLTWMEDEDYFKFDDDIYLPGGENIILDTTTGTKIGTATNQLLGFYNATPVDQPATVADATTQSLTGTDTLDKTKTETDLTSCKNAINSIIDRLQELGLIA